MKFNRILIHYTQDYDSSRATTKEKISETRTAFENILKINKLKRLEEYLKCLNEEEESLRKDFDQVLDKTTLWNI